ncbi:MAG TPA: AI-2E family transporter, partial [Planctomycetota bacterium]|nr:AI-2E family transporter [Planctomycetota bacterium]
VFLTFVFGYMAEHGVHGLAHRIHSRKVRTAIVFTTMIAIIALAITFIAPNLQKQAVVFVSNISKYEEAVDKSIADLRTKSDFWKNMLKDVTAKGVFNEVIGRSPAKADSNPEDRSHELAQLVLSIFRDVASVATTFLLALLFAFLIVADRKRIGRGIMSLQDTRLARFYGEVSRTVFRFGGVLGRFLEAQFFIALVNTALTSIGMWFLGIPNMAFLAGVVFICSFIPVAGTFLSTAPICLVALDHAGIGLVLWVIGMVSIVHAVEAYILNPMIFGAHLHMNPVLVLAVLLIGHKLFGVWGLLLCVPTVTYFFGHAIRHDPRTREADPAGGST